MSEATPNEITEALRRVLIANGADGPENRGYHSWRCQYPDRYGSCSCFEDLLSEMVAALPTGQAEQLAAAHDLLGGMYSWHDGFLDAPQNQHLWTVRAARILRELVGRAAHDPSPGASSSNQSVSNSAAPEEEEVLANWEGEGGAAWPDPTDR